MKWFSKNLAYVGAVLTVIYIMGILVLGFYAEPRLPFNELGDFFAGFMSPVALAWLIATLFVQRQELALQRQEMAEARQVANEQAIEQRRTAEANLKANLIAERTSLHIMSEQYKKRLEDIKKSIAASIREFDSDLKENICNSIDKSDFGVNYFRWLSTRKFIKFERFIDEELTLYSDAEIINTFAKILLKANRKINFVLDSMFDPKIKKLVLEMEIFWRLFDEFHKRAQETDSLILISADDIVLSSAIGRYFELQNVHGQEPSEDI
jgi:NADH:ubiquinone oxidoreductase subunit 5 (subunit L)/multisubunit Na+/H+ antiporter MnhA subunit